MAGAANDNDEVISAINVTPFVDIVLVLLIILMVTSTHIVKASLKVDLPKAASGGAAVESTLNIVLSKEGIVMLDGNQVSEKQLVQAVIDTKKTDPKAQAVIAADKGIEYGRVVRIIDLVKSNGIASFALNIERTNSVEPKDEAPVQP